jgi:tetratricopeptide (TPR) repeat protein
MARPHRALSPRHADPRLEGASGGDGDDERPRLRLVLTRGRLGVELERPFTLAPLSVEDLALSFTDVRFPVDLSGGVDAFRHRRGRLERLRIALPAAAVASWAPPRLRGLCGPGTPACVLAPVEDGWLVGVSHEACALAFEVLIAPIRGDVRLLATAARGLGLGGPPQLVAMRALEALARPLGALRAGVLALEGAAGAVGRALLPLAGMRAAAAPGELAWAPARAGLEETVLAADVEEMPASASERVLRALELAEIVAPAEEALLAGDVDRARAGYIASLERAPRHPEVARRLAELDLAVGGRGRAEAALGTLTEALPAMEAGILGARLLAMVGDPGARAAYRRAAAREPYGPLAALGWLEVAALADGDPSGAREALDEAVARAPSFAPVRWRRLETRLVAGDVRGAREDAEHLEASARGAAARHAVLRAAGERMARQRLFREALELFERSLRYLPDAPEAVARMAGALEALGHRRRALELYGRAVSLARDKALPAHGVVLSLARALVEVAGDRPAAVARVRSVPALVPETFEARLLEARWRSELGDLAGASVALVLLAEAVEQALGVLVDEVAGGPFPPLWGGDARFATREDARAALAAWLEEGARIEEMERRDLRAARRLLELSLRLAPQRRTVGQSFRRVLEAIRTAEAPPPVAPDTGGPTLVPPGPRPEDDEQLVERLGEKLRANPADLETVRALADALERLGRDLDLLALLSARIDEAAEGERAELVPRRRQALERLVAAARAAGREGEAGLYATMLENGG